MSDGSPMPEIASRFTIHRSPLMRRLTIEVRQWEGQSILTLEGRLYRFPFDLQPTDTFHRALDILVDALIHYNDEDTIFRLESCKFGHLTLPTILVLVTPERIEVSFPSTTDRRTRNQQITDRLVDLTLSTTDGNPFASYARSSIIDVVHASYCSLDDFRSAFAWEPSESLALYLYLDAIRN